MSIAQLAPATMTRPSARWLLLGSLALNLFFIAFAIALAIRPPAPAPAWDRDVFVRAERIAASLPANDATILRAQIGANRANIESAQAKFRAGQDVIRDSLRAEPFDAEALRASMANARGARQAFDQTIQGVFAGALYYVFAPSATQQCHSRAAKHSPTGRRAAKARAPSLELG